MIPTRQCERLLTHWEWGEFVNPQLGTRCPVHTEPIVTIFWRIESAAQVSHEGPWQRLCPCPIHGSLCKYFFLDRLTLHRIAFEITGNHPADSLQIFWSHEHFIQNGTTPSRGVMLNKFRIGIEAPCIIISRQ